MYVRKSIHAHPASRYEHGTRLWRRFQRGRLKRTTLVRKLGPVQGACHDLLERGIFEGTAKTGGVCVRIWNRYDSLWTFAEREGVEPSNNPIERALRPAVIWRKLSFGTASSSGSRYAERMLSLIATCRKRGHDVLNVVRKAVTVTRQGQPVPALP